MMKTFSQWVSERRRRRKEEANMRAIYSIRDHRVREEVLAQYHGW